MNFNNIKVINIQLFILEEIVDRPPEFQMFLNLFRQVDPVLILLDGKTQGAFVQQVKRTVFDTDAAGTGSCKLTFLSAREYSKFKMKILFNRPFDLIQIV